MIREFNYNGKARKFIPIQENGSYVMGIDLNYLPESEAKEVEEFFKEYQPTAEKVELPGYKRSWNVGWRKFKKSNIS